MVAWQSSNARWLPSTGTFSFSATAASRYGPSQGHPLRHAHRTHPFVPGERHAHEPRLVLQKTAIKVSVVGNYRGIANECENARQHPVNGVGVRHHFVRDSRQLTNSLRDAAWWTHWHIQHLLAGLSVLNLTANDGNLDDGVAFRTESGRLYVEHAERRRVVVRFVRLDGPLDERAPPAPGREVSRPISIDILYANSSDAGRETDRERRSDRVAEPHHRCCTPRLRRRVRSVALVCGSVMVSAQRARVRGVRHPPHRHGDDAADAWAWSDNMATSSASSITLTSSCRAFCSLEPGFSPATT